MSQVPSGRLQQKSNNKKLRKSGAFLLSSHSRHNFDAWGRRRNPSTWNYEPIGSSNAWHIRGYTGHEQLDRFHIVHMNGRLYDPVIGRMFSADNFVQDPYFSQSYNRYTYVLNNPLKYTDPTGELTFYDIAAGAAIAGGTALMFVPGAQPVGATLIMGGVTHFAASAALAQQGSSWNEASNVAGLSFTHQQYFAATTGPAAGPAITGTGPTGIQYYAVDAQRGYEADYYAFNTDDPMWGVSEWDRTLASTDMEWEFLYGYRQSHGTPWMDFAVAELGTEEIIGTNHNERIIEYLRTTGSWWNSDETPWCSGFTNWVFKQASIEGTNNARAYSWLNWGQELSLPAYGAIAVMDYSHVGFVAGINSDGRLILLGGNQGKPGSVNLSPNSVSSVKSYRYPAGHTPNYNLPIYDLVGRSLDLSTTR